MAWMRFTLVTPVPGGHDDVVNLLNQLEDATADLPGFFGLVQRVAAAVPVALGAQGTFVANNNVVSQSVAHLHFHVVPRTKGDGLRGFFWPRHKYASDEEAASFAASIAAKLG